MFKSVVDIGVLAKSQQIFVYSVNGEDEIFLEDDDNYMALSSSLV
jgi:hypothetical protein